MSTYLCLYCHLVFSTKHREPMIVKERQAGLHGYLAGVVEGLDAKCEIAGGTADHVHLLVGFRATHRLADFMRELKKASSIWMHGDAGQKSFAWQEGYGAFNVSASALDEVRRYIENQEEHHRTRSFRDELAILLRKSNIKYDDRYLD